MRLPRYLLREPGRASRCGVKSFSPHCFVAQKRERPYPALLAWSVHCWCLFACQCVSRSHGGLTPAAPDGGRIRAYLRFACSLLAVCVFPCMRAFAPQRADARRSRAHRTSTTGSRVTWAIVIVAPRRATPTAPVYIVGLPVKKRLLRCTNACPQEQERRTTHTRAAGVSPPCERETPLQRHTRIHRRPTSRESERRASARRASENAAATALPQLLPRLPTVR